MEDIIIFLGEILNVLTPLNYLEFSIVGIAFVHFLFEILDLLFTSSGGDDYLDKIAMELSSGFLTSVALLCAGYLLLSSSMLFANLCYYNSTSFFYVIAYYDLTTIMQDNLLFAKFVYHEGRIINYQTLPLVPLIQYPNNVTTSHIVLTDLMYEGSSSMKKVVYNSPASSLHAILIQRSSTDLKSGHFVCLINSMEYSRSTLGDPRLAQNIQPFFYQLVEVKVSVSQTSWWYDFEHLPPFNKNTVLIYKPVTPYYNGELILPDNFHLTRRYLDPNKGPGEFYF